MFYGLYSWSSSSFDPVADIPSLEDKVVLITGATSGIGLSILKTISLRNPASIYLAVREPSISRAEAEIQNLKVSTTKVTVIPCDLTSLSSVHSFVREFKSQQDSLDLLFLNAGIMAISPSVTEDGYEVQFAANYLGHALMTLLLMPVLLSAARSYPARDVRIITCSSIGHISAPLTCGINFDSLKTDMSAYPTLIRYAQSKLANLLFSRELARRYSEITAVSVQPGIVDTGLWGTVFRESIGWANVGPWWGLRGVERAFHVLRKWFSVSASEGARGLLWGAFAQRGTGCGEVRSGGYYTPVGVGGNEGIWGRSDDLAQRLWMWMEGELRSKGHEITQDSKSC